MASIEEEIAARRQAAQQARSQPSEPLLSNQPRDLRQTPGGSGVAPNLVGDAMTGLGEAALTMGSGAASIFPMAMGGIAALGEGGSRAIRGEENPFRDAGQTVRSFQDTMPIYEPRTQAGQDVLQNLSAPFEALDRGLVGAADWVQDLEGDMNEISSRYTGEYERPGAILPAAIRSAADIVGVASPLKRAPSTLAQTMAKRSQLDDMGLNPYSGFDRNVRDITAQAGRRGADQPPSTGMGDVQTRVRQLDVDGREAGSQLFKEAEQAGAVISTDFFRPLSARVNRINRDYSAIDSPSVNKIVGELNDLSRKTLQEIGSLGSRLGERNVATNTINEVMDIRQRLTNAMPDNWESPEYKALAQIRDELDNFMDVDIKPEMIQGDRNAIKLWEGARDHWRNHRELYDSTRAITNLRRGDSIDPTAIKKSLFQANASNQNSFGASNVKALKQILGGDSPEFRTLQQSVMSDVMFPLTQRTPDIEGFSMIYDRMVRNNPDMMKELFDKKTLDDMQTLADYSYAAARETPRGEIDNIQRTRMLAAGMVGSNLARAQARQNIVSQLLNKFNPEAGPRRHNRIMSSLTDTNRSDMFPKASIGLPASMEAMRAGGDENERMRGMSINDRINTMLGR